MKIENSLRRIVLLAAFVWVAMYQSAPALDFPSTISKKTNVKNGPWIETEVKIQGDGQVFIKNHVWNSSAVCGYHGDVLIFLCEENGNRIAAIGPFSYGVDGEWVPWGTNDRTDRETCTLPPNLLSRVSSVTIEHEAGTSKEAFKKRLEDLDYVLDKACLWIKKAKEAVKDAQ